MANPFQFLQQTPAARSPRWSGPGRREVLTTTANGVRARSGFRESSFSSSSIFVIRQGLEMILTCLRVSRPPPLDFPGAGR